MTTDGIPTVDARVRSSLPEMDVGRCVEVVVGLYDGSLVGIALREGFPLGPFDGTPLGPTLGLSDGTPLGRSEGISLGLFDGRALGPSEGLALGTTEGLSLGV